MATPDDRGRTWRFRLNDTSTLEVSTPPRATEKQIRRRGRVWLAFGAVLAALMMTTVALSADLKADLNAAAPGNQQNKDLGNVVGGDTYQFTTDVFFQGGPSTVTSVTFAHDGNLPNFVTGATGGTATRSSGNGESTRVQSTITVVPPCTLGAFGGNGPAKLVAAAVQYEDTAVIGAADVGHSTAWINIQGTVTSLGSDCTPPAPSDTTPPDNASVVINNGAAWTNSTSVVLDLAAHDAVGITRYRLAETQAGLDSAADVAVSPTHVNFTADDVAFTLSAGDSATKAVWARFCDAADNCTDATDTIGLDTVKPVITGSTGSYVPGTWTNQDVVVSFTCADNAGVANSGIATSTVAGTTLTTSGANQSVTNTGSCTDNAGNVADAVTVSDIDIDKVPPTVACNAASFVLNEPGAQVSASVTDALSGPLNTTEHGATDTSSVGLKTVSITGYDNAGNSTTASCPYMVGYNFAGLFAPIDKPNTMNVSKAGQAIPLKWRLTDYFGNPVTNLASATVTVTGIACSLGSTADQVEEVAAGGSGLQNLGDGYYQINWKSPTSYAGSCKSLNLNLGEGMTRTSLAYISFKK